MRPKIIFILFLVTLIGCSGVKDTIYKRDIVYQGWFLSTDQDSITFTITRRYDIIHNLDSSQLKHAKKGNPFSPGTSIYFNISNKQDSVRFEIGRDSVSFNSIYSGLLLNGDYDLSPDTKYMKSGIFYLRQTIGQKSDIKKFLLLR